MVVDFAGPTPPTGWLLCNGAAVSRTTYAALWVAIGGYYGSGDGSTTFNLPDTRGRTSIGAGQGTGLTNRPLAQQISNEEVHALAVGELAVHNHSVATGQFNHSHGTNETGHAHRISGSAIAPGGGAGNVLSSYNVTTAVVYTETLTTNLSIVANTLPAGSTDNNGSSTAHNNMQPSIVFNKIIRT
jgi:microcystin-dependent protein